MNIGSRGRISSGKSAFQLRYDAYVRNDLLEPRADRRIFDKYYDVADNAWITLTFLDGELAATTRLNLWTREGSPIPSMAVYPDVVTPKLRAGFSILETTRLAANLGISGSNPELAYVAMRPGFMAATHFDIDFAVASPRLEHMAFYRRVLLFSQWCEPRPYPGLTAKFGCMGAEFRASRERIEARYPFFKSDPAEREALFGPSKGRSDRTGGEHSAVGLVRSA